MSGASSKLKRNDSQGSCCNLMDCRPRIPLHVTDIDSLIQVGRLALRFIITVTYFLPLGGEAVRLLVEPCEENFKVSPGEGPFEGFGRLFVPVLEVHEFASEISEASEVVRGE